MAIAHVVILVVLVLLIVGVRVVLVQVDYVANRELVIGNCNEINFRRATRYCINEWLF